MTELHVHLDGSLRPETVWELAREQGIALPARSVEELRTQMQAPVPCGSLGEYLSRFAVSMTCLQTEEALERVAFELGEDMAAEGMDLAEIRFAPQYSTRQGLSQEQVTEAVIRGVRRSMDTYPGLRLGLILCCMRGDDREAERFNQETLELAAAFQKGGVVCGVDLAGAEEVYDTGRFRELFSRAERLGLKRTIHAGEAAGPESVWKALELGAMRIGHGVASIRDERLVRELAERKIPLEVCIVSNVQTKAVPSLAEHPIRRLFDAGVRVTLNTDNRTVSDTTLSREIQVAREAFGFTDQEIQRMEEYAREASFLRQARDGNWRGARTGVKWRPARDRDRQGGRTEK